MNNKITKEYKIEIIASIIENALFCTNEELFSFCEEIINKEVDIMNLQNNIDEITNELKEQYPSLKRITPYPTSDFGEYYINEIIKFYKNIFGDTITIEVYPRKIKKLKPFHFKY